MFISYYVPLVQLTDGLMTHRYLAPLCLAMMKMFNALLSTLCSLYVNYQFWKKKYSLPRAQGLREISWLNKKFQSPSLESLREENCQSLINRILMGFKMANPS